MTCHKKKEQVDIEILGIQDVYSLGQMAKSMATRMLVYVLFLSCARLSEALKLRKKDFVFTTMQVRKNGQSYTKNILLFKNMPVLKRKAPIVRTPPIIVDDDPVKWQMIEEIKTYLEGIPEDNMRLFPFKKHAGSMRIRRIGDKMEVKSFQRRYGTTEEIVITTNLYAHYLRHCGITYLVNKYQDLSELKLTAFVGWADTRMTKRYYDPSWLDMIKAMS